MPVSIRRLVAGATALGALTALALGVTSPASAAPAKGWIAAPNGMVGIQESITIYAPSAAGQVVSVGLQSAASASTAQTTIAANGYGTLLWTPTTSGAWSINALGNIVSAGSSNITVSAMPTYTVLLAQNNVQAGVSNNLTAGVVAPVGTIAPQGSVYLASANGNGITTQPLSGQFGGSTSFATLPWTPQSLGAFALLATFQPGGNGQTGSVSPISQPNINQADTIVALRWPATLYQGTPTVLQAVLGQNIPQGSVAFYQDGVGISASIPTVNGVATFPWTPNLGGVHNISVAFTANQPIPGAGTSSSSSQLVNIQPARTSDNVTVDPTNQPVWSIAKPIVMQAGTSTTLVGTATSGTPVYFSEQGPCIINGAVLQALSAGSCQVTASAVGNATLTPVSETYTVTVTAAPKSR